MGRPAKKKNKLPKAMPRLLPNSNPGWHHENMERAVKIWKDELRLHELDYNACPYTEYDLAALTFVNGNELEESQIFRLIDAVRDHMHKHYHLQVERFHPPGRDCKICMPTTDMLDAKAEYLLTRANQQFTAAVKADQRNPGVMSINPVEVLGMKVVNTIKVLNVDPEDTKLLVQDFAKTFANQQQINGKTNAEIKKALYESVIGGHTLNNPQLQQFDAKYNDQYAKDCAKMADDMKCPEK